MKGYMSAPCPQCSGLVTDTLHCTKCNASWASEKDMLLDGCFETSRRAVVIVESLGVNAQYWDMIALRERYGTMLEKIEVKEFINGLPTKSPS